MSAFDERRGLGEVTADDGAVYPFHATAIADGTRTVAVTGDDLKWTNPAGSSGGVVELAFKRVQARATN